MNGKLVLFIIATIVFSLFVGCVADEEAWGRTETSEKHILKIGRCIVDMKKIQNTPNFWYNKVVEKLLPNGGFSMLKDKDMQLSIYSLLSFKIPKNHKLNF